MVLLSIFFTNQIHGGSSAGVLYSFLSLHALALHLAVKYYFKSFCMKIWARWPIHTSSRLYFPPECQQDRYFVTQPILLSENIPNIWRKSSTKHKEVRPNWNDKADNANCIYNDNELCGSSCHFKEIFDQVRKDLDCELFYSELKRHNVSHYIYYLATNNIHISTENDNTVLIKGLKKVVNVKFSETRIL